MLVLALRTLSNRLIKLYDECLKYETSPTGWKRAKLILLPKPGRNPDSPSAFRPICLLNETDKLLEKIIANRVTRHLTQKTWQEVKTVLEQEDLQSMPY